MILPGTTPITDLGRAVPAMRKSSAETRLGLHAVEPDRRPGRAGEERLVDEASARDDVGDRAVFKVVQQHDVGALAGRDHAAVA